MTTDDSEVRAAAVAAYLMPFLAMTGAGLISRAFSGGDSRAAVRAASRGRADRARAAAPPLSRAGARLDAVGDRAAGRRWASPRSGWRSSGSGSARGRRGGRDARTRRRARARGVGDPARADRRGARLPRLPRAPHLRGRLRARRRGRAPVARHRRSPRSRSGSCTTGRSPESPPGWRTGSSIAVAARSATPSSPTPSPTPRSCWSPGTPAAGISGPDRRRLHGGGRYIAAHERLPVPGDAARSATRRHALPPAHHRPRVDLRGGGQDLPAGRARGADAADARGDARHRAPAAARAPRAAARASSTTPRPRPTTASSRSSCSRTPTSPRAACCRRARTPAPRSSWARRASYVFTGGGDEAAIARGVFDTYRDREPALLAAGAARHVQGGQHRQQPAGADRDLRDRRRRLQVPLHGQGRRLGQQELPLSGDEGAPEPDEPAGVRRGEAARARHGGLPAVPPRDRHRRHVGASTRSRPRSSPRRATSTRCRPRATSSGAASATVELEAQGARSSRSAPASARSSAASTSATTCASIRLPRHGASCPVGIAVSCSADRQALGKITQDGVFLEQLETDPGEVPARDRRTTSSRARW